MNRTITNRLSAHAGTQAAELIVHADAAGDAVRRIIQRSWAELWRTIQPGPHSFQANFHNTARILNNLTHAIQTGLRDQLRGMFLWSHHRAAKTIIGTLPKAYMRAAVATKLMESRQRPHNGEHVRLLENGAVQLGVVFRDGELHYEPHSLTIDPRDEPDFWEHILFPSPPASDVEHILDRILAYPTAPTPTIGDAVQQSPVSLAQTIAQQVASGRSSQDIAITIRPIFDGSANRAERTSRTLGAYVGTERNLATSEQLGDLVMGYQVHSAGGENARHDHAMRSGTIYYRAPKQGQIGMDVMPHPPVDTGRGPFEEITGIRFNCRCWISPVLTPLPAMETPAFTENADKLIPDVSHFADWFATASTPQRRAAAGVRRIATAAEVLGREPTWADLVNPESGKLLTLAELQGETPAEQSARVSQVNHHISRNRAAIQKVAAFGTA